MFQAETVLVSQKPSTGWRCWRTQASQWCSGIGWKQEQDHKEEKMSTDFIFYLYHFSCTCPSNTSLYLADTEEINIYCRNLRLYNSKRIHQVWIFNFWMWEGAICNHLHILLTCYWMYISAAYIMQKSIIPYLCTLYYNYYNLIGMGCAGKVIWDNKVQ